MMNNSHRNNSGRQRLAWVIMLSSFFVCAAITIAVPVAVNAYLHNATEFLSIIVQANQGTVSIDDGSDVPKAVRVGEPGEGAEPGASILTDTAAIALMSVFLPDSGAKSEQLLARLHVYGNTSVVLEQSTVPRFTMSDAGPTMQLDLEGGRLRLSVPEFEERPFLFTIITPQGTITFQEPGQYSIIVNDEETQVAVQAGRAHVVAIGHYVDLETAQRSVIRTGEMPSAPLGTERNLIQNSNFSEGWDNWSQYVWEIEQEPAGQVTVESINGEPTLHIRREGIGAAEVKVRQPINQAITESETLFLEIEFRIVNQSLAVCGGVGSECPLTVRVDYKDINGNSQVWWQGFYAVGESDSMGTPDVCETCPSPRLVHRGVVLGQIGTYQFNLIEELKREAFLPPSRINSISLQASGHSFEVEVLSVTLLVEELANGE